MRFMRAVTNLLSKLVKKKEPPPPSREDLAISPSGLELIKRWEGCKLTAYKCPAGIWTIGYGRTGPDVVEGTTCSQDDAERWLRNHCAVLGYKLKGHSKVALTQGQLDALVSFTYNLGFEALLGSTLWRKHQAGDFSGAKGEFAKWVHVNKKPLPGLVARRKEEAAVYGS